MKYRILFKLSFALIIACFAGNFSFAQNTIEGTVRYSDDNSPVSTGIVKAYDIYGTYVGYASIQSNGTYAIAGLPGTQYDIIGMPNIEGEADFPPTGYPNTINPNAIQTITVMGVVVDKDIYVQRLSLGGGFAQTTNISGIVKENGVVISDAVVYALQGSKIYGFAISDSKGHYKIESLPVGNYIIVVHRLSDNSSSINIDLGPVGAENVDFNIKPLINNKNIATNSVAFTLNQNYPNPFNPSTLISYMISKDSHVDVKVYNSLGELVTELINADQKAGAYSLKFDGTGLSSGIYFYKLTSGSFTDTKRMILVK